MNNLNMIALVTKLKNENEDFEFYPTTDEIIMAFIRNLKKLDSDSYSYNFSFNSILDIGAGNGKVLNAVEKAFNTEYDSIKLYAIEKAETLKNLINQGIYLIGTDFNEQSLLDKTMSVTFCNPPYSEYQKWAVKIIRESCSQYIYLVIPQRWINSRDISEALKYRDAEAEIIGNFGFQDAEDRKARAIIDLIRIKLSTEKDDAFDRFFNEEFKELKDKMGKPKDKYSYESQEDKVKEKFHHLVTGENYIKALVTMYNLDIENIQQNYLSVKYLDVALLKEFDISVEKILTLLKEKLKGLKNLYWHELIGRMDKITSRLIGKKRNMLLDKLNENGYVDFTESNIYAIVLWILKNAGSYIDEQLLDVYEELMSQANCKNYKSNKRVFEQDNWRYNQEKPTHVFLDFRLVLYCWGALEHNYSGDSKHTLTENASEHIRDLLTIANNLGFICNSGDGRLYRWSRDEVWIAGKPQIFEYRDKQKFTPHVLFEVKAHKNGNLHIRLNQKFALALNVEYGRLKGWIHSKDNAEEELSDSNAGLYFKTNYSLLSSPFIQIEKKQKNDIQPNLFQEEDI